MIMVGLSEDVPADWADIQARARALCTGFVASADVDLEHRAAALAALREEIRKLFQN